MLPLEDRRDCFLTIFLEVVVSEVCWLKYCFVMEDSGKGLSVEVISWGYELLSGGEKLSSVDGGCRILSQDQTSNILRKKRVIKINTHLDLNITLI